MISIPALTGRFSASLFVLAVLATAPARAQDPAAEYYRTEIQPLLQEYCYDCHGRGVRKGQIAFDEMRTDEELLARPELWHTALRNVRAGIMPPEEEGYRPTADELAKLENWVKYQAFGIDPNNPDPGRLTVRRLNRVEYRNTIRDLMGIDFNSEVEFPADDSGHGFDNIGDVLSISPLHLEKYLQAADIIANTAIPKVSRVLQRRVATVRDFQQADGSPAPAIMSVKEPMKVAHTFTVEHTEDYRITADLLVRGTFDFDPGRAQLIMTVNGQERHREEIVWSESRPVKIEFPEQLAAGDHVIAFAVEPLDPVKPKNTLEDAVDALAATPQPPPVAAAAAPDAAAPVAAPAVPPSVQRPRPPPNTRLDVRITSVEISGPAAEKFWVTPDNHARFFPKGAAPEDPAARLDYAREVLRRFATRAYRRPVTDAQVEQLVNVARETYEQPGATFEEGFAKAAMVVLASPRFLFRIEGAQPGSASTPTSSATSGGSALADEYTLASRLSYLFWSSMPDDELFELAAAGQLRANLAAQTARMMEDTRSQAFIRNFTGQWLQVRDVESIPVNPRAILNIGNQRGGPRVDFDAPIRRAMRTETDMAFEYVMRNDLSVLELIDSNYTFLNERLATHYGIADVVGDAFRRVELPADSPRGGVLTHGAVLTVTSNPTRTSPVKRGMFILENILGTPPPPPPDNVPSLEEAEVELSDNEPTLRQLLASHRENVLCSSCHERMDPLGLAFENFNAMGMWRDEEAGQPIETTGELVTGESFANVRELKRVLATERRLDYYRCLTEKLLTYALGRGMEYYDIHTVDQIVNQLEADQGRFSTLLQGVINSAPFQRLRLPARDTTATAQTHSQPTTATVN